MPEEHSVLPQRLRQSVSLYRLLRFAPVLTLLPLLTVAVPASYLPSREIAHYFQALAFAQDGLQSYGYVTARESGAALHVYSLILTPFVELGYTVAGRYVSALAALGASILLAYIGRELFNSNAGFLAPLLLWANPFFYRFAWAYMPDALSIFFTVAAVASMLRYTRTSDRRWFLTSSAVLVLGIANHGWEATIVLPIVVLLFLHQKRTQTVAYTGLAVAAIAAVKYLVSLQSLPTTGNGYLVTNTGFSIYLTSEFWLGVVTMPYSPFYLGHSLLFYPGLLAFAYWLFNWRRGVTPTTSAVMAAWIVSGLAIPFAFPGGLLHHYYLWALIAPVTLTAAAILPRIIESIRLISGEFTAAPVVRGLVVVLVCWTAVLGFGFEFGAITGASGAPPAVGDRHADSSVPPAEAVAAGNQLADVEVTDPNDIVFVSPESNRLNRQTIYRVLVHGDVLLRDTWIPEFTAESTATPQHVTDRPETENCQVIIEKQGDQLYVTSCS